ncbi:Bll2902 protein [hydrothermal vent metagenome]|uniref:Bll2902 protein n=1 Tax=hydrothermal vent metagenome TaxID=652676 RepID=A0A3B0SYA4_9ZZZZ
MAHFERTTHVHETGQGKYQNKIEIGKHEFFASEPVDLGGDDSGPTPVEIVNAALGACTSITLRMYADRKGWPLESVSVEVSHKRGIVEECESGDNEQTSRPQEIFTKTIRLTGPLSSEQKQRLLEIAEKCPVHKILKQPACMRSSLAS